MKVCSFHVTSAKFKSKVNLIFFPCYIITTTLWFKEKSASNIKLLNKGFLSQNTTILCCYLYLSRRHVSAFALGHLQVTRYIIEETVQCES